LSNSRGCTVTVPCGSDSSVARSKAKASLKSIFCRASRLSRFASSGPAIGLTDHAAHREHDHVARRRALICGKDWESKGY
jgi:hypothetical protein